MIATQELVVPRSIPIILPMIFSFYMYRRTVLSFGFTKYAEELCAFKSVQPSSVFLFCLRCGDDGRTQQAVGNHVALLQHVHHGIGFLFGRHDGDGLMLHGIEFLAHGRQDFDQLVALEGRLHLFQSHLDAFLERLDGGAFHVYSHFQAVAHRKHGLGEAFHGELVRLADVFLGAAADIFALGLGTHEGVVHFRQFGLGLAQLLFQRAFWSGGLFHTVGRLRAHFLVFLVLHRKAPKIEYLAVGNLASLSTIRSRWGYLLQFQGLLFKEEGPRFVTSVTNFTEPNL